MPHGTPVLVAASGGVPVKHHQEPHLRPWPESRRDEAGLRMQSGPDGLSGIARLAETVMEGDEWPPITRVSASQWQAGMQVNLTARFQILILARTQGFTAVGSELRNHGRNSGERVEAGKDMEGR